MGHKSFYLLILISCLLANEDDFKAKKIMEKGISQPNPATSISEVKLEIVRKELIRKKENLGLSLDMKNVIRIMNIFKSPWSNF